MKTLFLALLICLPLFMTAQTLNEYKWKSRVLLLFTPDADDPVFLQQYQLFGAATDELEERNVQIVFISPGGNHENTGLFLDESTSKQYYDRFSVAPFQFELILVGLDGHEKFRARNTTTPVSIILEMIDGMPMRKAEIMQGYGNESKVSSTGGGGR